MQFKNGLSIIEALVTLLITILLGLIAVPVVLTRMGGARPEDHIIAPPSPPSEKKVVPIDFPKPERPDLPLFKGEGGLGIDKEGAAKDIPTPPSSSVPK